MKKNINAFTLIEVVVSVTIFSIIMISIISIYILSSDTSLKSDINRAMHENMKSVITEISEDVMKNGIIGVSENTLDTCSFNVSTSYKQGSKLCTKGLNEYYLAKKIGTGFIRTDNITCENIAEQCYVVKNGKPLTNSLVAVKNIDFYVSSLYVNKVTIKIILQPTIKAGVKPNLIENNKLIFQTTISERPF
ncbi:MAG: prepilin-type N-terminal cleavage/methylation domain-containing protein [Candidatus Gracilibacteria bacterium]|nr:prepilin-type N-terminal cleavage/methylation domain-containing protein [Candidatus Gracilibacteria bacterium]